MEKDGKGDKSNILVNWTYPLSLAPPLIHLSLIPFLLSPFRFLTPWQALTPKPSGNNLIAAAEL